MTDSHSSNESAQAVGTVMDIALGYLVSRSLHVVTQLGVADLLADGQARAPAEIAECLGVDALAVRRLLRTLAAQGVFQEQADGRFVLNAAARLLQSGVMRDGVLFCGEVAGDGSWWDAVGALEHSVRTGRPAFDFRHGVGFFDYLRTHEECARWFDRGMANFATSENLAIAQALDCAPFTQVVDVGGGQGGFLSEVLARHPNLRGTLFDQPQVVAQPAHLDARIASERWQTAAGDFFVAVPAGADAYFLKRILHDWDDERSLAILTACRAAMSARARLFIVDAVLPFGNAPHPGKVMDVLMMVFGSGRERTAAEFDELCRGAGLAMRAIVPTASMLSVIEVERRL